MHIIIYGVLLLLLVLIFTLLVLCRSIKLKKACEDNMLECIALNKILDNDRVRLFSMYQDAKAECRAYQIMREKLEKHLKEGSARFISGAEAGIETSGSLYLDPLEAGMLYDLLSKLQHKEMPA